MSTAHRFEIPELFPQPKFVEMGEGISELAVDVRLATANVWPIQRKALRSILTMAGVRVVANKKKYIVDARVIDPIENPDAFNLKGIPQTALRDYYELRIQGSEVYLTSPCQDGIVWAAQTLGILFKMMLNGLAVPNLTIRDWSVLPYRGTLLKCDLTTAYMPQSDWLHAIDVFSRAKLNMLGIGLCGCTPSALPFHTEKQDAFIMTPHTALENDEAAKAAATLHQRYYSAKFDRWYDRIVPPAMFQEDFLGDIITYGRERGMMVYPYIELSASSTSLSRVLPELSACDNKGKHTGQGICLTSQNAVKALCSYLDDIIDKNFVSNVDFLHLAMPGFMGKKLLCQCASCRKQTDPAKAFLGFLSRVFSHLFDKQVANIILTATDFGSDSKAIKNTIGNLLKLCPQAKQHLYITWPHGQQKLLPVAIPGVQNWLCTSGNKAAFDNVVDCRKDIDASCADILKNQELQGLLLDSEYDQSCISNYSLLGARCWETLNCKNEDFNALESRSELLRWQSAFKEIEEAQSILRKCAVNPTYLKTLPLQFCIGGKSNDAVTYPLCLFKKIDAPQKYIKELREIAQNAADAAEKLRPYLDNEVHHWCDNSLLALQSLFGHLCHICAHSSTIASLLKLNSDASAKKTSPQKLEQEASKVRQELLKYMLDVEANLEDCLIPLVMFQLGYFKLLLEQLCEDFKALGKKKSAAIRWSLPEGWQPPEDK